MSLLYMEMDMDSTAAGVRILKHSLYKIFCILINIMKFPTETF